VPIIQTPSPVESLRVEYKIREPFGLFLAEEIVPVAIVSDLSGQSVAQSGYPRQAIGVVDVAAGAAGTEVHCVCVGVGFRGKVYVVHKCVVNKPTAGLIQLRVSNTASGLTPITTKAYADLRVLADTPDMQIAQITPAGAQGDQIGRFTALATTPLEIDLGITLGLGQALFIRNGDAAEGLTTTFYWTEHLIEDR